MGGYEHQPKVRISSSLKQNGGAEMLQPNQALLPLFGKGVQYGRNFLFDFRKQHGSTRSELGGREQLFPIQKYRGNDIVLWG